MTVLPQRVDATRIRRFFTQLFLVSLINVPSISFGLAMGWVSLESGASGEGRGDGDGEETGMALVGAAAATFLAGALAMPVAARAIAAGRKPAMLATSTAFIVCWSLKLCGSWGIVVGRAAAGLGGTIAWVIPPMLANEMCCAQVRGAAAVALVLAHNVGFLLMYLAADYEIPHRTVLVCCLSLSVLNFIAYMFVPESPAYLAANGKYKEARAALAWCRGYTDSASPELDVELKALPEPDLEPVSPFRLAKDMLSDIRRRKAFIIAIVTVVGQEMCGVLTLLQFAERVFSLARDAGAAPEDGEREGGASSDAVVLGAVQLVASALALYLVEKIGRRLLLVWGAVMTGVCLGAGAGAVWAGSRRGALAALATAVFADSAGLQPAPYALLAEMFTYQYRGCASLLVTAASDLGNAVEIVVFPSIVHGAGLAAALAVAAVLTLALAAYAACTVPETMDRTPEEIYEILCPGLVDDPTHINIDKSIKREEFNNEDDLRKRSIESDDDDEENDEDLATNTNIEMAKSEATGINSNEEDHFKINPLIRDKQNEIKSYSNKENNNGSNEHGQSLDKIYVDINCTHIQHKQTNNSKSSVDDVNFSPISQEDNLKDSFKLEPVDNKVISHVGRDTKNEDNTVVSRAAAHSVATDRTACDSRNDEATAPVEQSNNVRSPPAVTL